MKRNSSSTLARICRFILYRVISPVLGVALLLILGLYLLCTFKQDYVADLVEGHLREQTNLPFTVDGPVKPLLFPRPGVSVDNLRLAAADMSLEGAADSDSPLLSISSLEVTVDLPSYMRDGHLARIVLDTPLVTLAYAPDGTPLWVPLQDSNASESEAPNANGSGRPGLDKDLWSLTTPLSISKGGLRMLDPAGEEVLELRGIQAEVDPEETMYPIRLQAGLRLLKGELEMDCTLALGPTAPDDTLNVARGRFTGDLRLTPPGSRTLTAELFSSLFMQKNGGLALPDFQIAAEGDALTLHLSMDPEGPSCSGKAMIRTLSLPRWFHFGRNLPPGLQAALHRVSGVADLHVDAKSAAVYNLNGKAGDLPVAGLVSVDDFSKPVVLVDLSLDSVVSLDEIFPFLAVQDSLVPAPEEPVFDHPTLVPYPGPAAAEDLPDVGYDVRVAAAKPIAHSLPAGPVLVKVLPVKEFAQVTFTCGDIMKGAVDGILDIGEKKVGMVYRATGVDLALLPENKDSDVQVQGRADAVVRMDIPVHDDGAWADVWKFKFAGKTDNLKLLVSGGSPWNLPAKKTDLSMDGIISTNRSKGVYLEGIWKLDAKNVSPSWNPKGADAFTVDMNGRLSWPPFIPEMEHGRRIARRGGLESITGAVTAAGTLHTPLGRRMVPVSGTLTGNLDWNIDKEILRLDKAALDGLGSYFGSNLLIDMHGKKTTITADSSFKLNPRVFLKEWDLLPEGGARVPANISGASKITATSDTVDFGNLDLQIDGAPASGTIKLAFPTPAKGGAQEQLWTIRLNADQLDLDNYFPPAKPEDAGKPRSTTPWDLSAMQGLNFDAQIKLKRTRLRKLSMQDMLVSAALQRNRFTFAFQVDKMYEGSGVFLAQGSLDPGAGRVTLNTANLQVKSIELGKALADLLADDSNSYGGKASLAVIASGSMGCEREIFSGMSGTWNLGIKDGIYPAFLGSETAGLRNTFSSASASGALDKGVVRWDNFKLTSTMVDMNGDGSIDLGGRVMDFTVYVTLARVPTVPVRFQGPFDAPSMSLRGAHMVVHTAKAAGITVFDLFMGVLELPGRAAKGVGDLFSSGTPDKDKDKKPQTKK